LIEKNQQNFIKNVSITNSIWVREMEKHTPVGGNRSESCQHFMAFVHEIAMHLAAI